MKHRKLVIVVALALVVALAWQGWRRLSPPGAFDAGELAILASLSLDSLPPLPPDPSNAVADDPRAARLGHALFFERRMSANGGIACATCHQPIRHFTDGLPRGVAIGVSRRNTPSIVGTAYSPWQYWDGRKDSQWSQALSPLEDPNEHGSDRLRILSLIASEPAYRGAYEELFGGPPSLLDDAEVDRAFANVGRAIAAYERLLMPGRSRFDDYARHVLDGGDPLEQPYLDSREIHGLKLFIGKARCIECHNGPLFTNNEFHNTGLLSPPGELPDRGRLDGVREVLADPFNCLGAMSDDPDGDCPELRFVRTGPELIGATRTPSLRNVSRTAPYQSRGQFATLDEVLDHYNRAPLAMIGHNEAEPLGLAGWEIDRLIAFLHALDAPVDVAAEWLEPPAPLDDDRR
jgi:cytochrome c peroxidase